MFEINEDKTINITRGDIGAFTVDALNEAGEKYLFQKGDVVRIKVTEKKACENVMFQKDFVVEEETEQVELLLTEDETKIGEVISKPTDYWYEIELNPLTNPQTIIGYDEDGAKIFKLYPEGNDIEPVEPTPEDIPVVDEELDITSERPVQNQAITRAMLNLQEEIERVENTKNISSEDLEPLVVGIEENKGNIAKNKGNIEDLTSNVENLSNTLDTHTADKNNPHNVTAEQTSYDNSISGMNADSVQGAIDELKGTLGYTSKNLLRYPYNNTTVSRSGIDWTDIGDGTLKVNGLATGNSGFDVQSRSTNPLSLKKGTYKVSGCPKGGGDTTYFLRVIKTGVSGELVNLVYEYGEGATFTLDEDCNTIGVQLQVSLNTKVENLVFKPMIRPASIEDDTYEPYVEDLNTKLQHYAYLDIKDKLTINATNCNINQAFVKNGNVFINGNIKGSVSTGVLNLFTLPNGYAPQYSIGANVFSYNNVADLSKIANVVITPSNRTATAWVTGALSGNTDFNFVYALI